jgi:hypothetical protein
MPGAGGKSIQHLAFPFSLRFLSVLGVSAVSVTENLFTAETQRTRRLRREKQTQPSLTVGYRPELRFATLKF